LSARLDPRLAPTGAVARPTWVRIFVLGESDLEEIVDALADAVDAAVSATR
jgi:hypothetical protein